MQPVIYSADIGSIAGGNLGWARLGTATGSEYVERSGGTEVVDLVSAVAGELDAERPVALSFECPLFVPVPANPRHLGKYRKGDGDRSWSAGPGPTVLATG